MQHLDEGTIHSWLDGALTPEEEARAEAHVKDCPQCQAAVAEARGFIAASSRILTALDNAPRGVIPAAAPSRRVQPWVWRVAATVLVVATGTFLVLNERGGKSYQTSAPQVGLSQAVADSASTMPVATEKAASSPSVVTEQAAPGVVSGVVAAPTSPPLRAGSLAKKQPAPTRNAAEGNLGAPGDQRLDEERGEVARVRPEPTAPVAAASPMMRSPSVAAFDVASASAPREVETKRMLGRTQTLYEVAPGDTVVLEEQSSAQLESVVTTGAATGVAADRRALPLANRAAGKAAAVAETQQKTEAAAAPAPPPPVAALQADGANIHRISWLDRSSGRVLILSGRHSQEELEEIRRRIQRLRDAAAQSKKLPD